jgi:hypothetical protein
MESGRKCNTIIADFKADPEGCAFTSIFPKLNEQRQYKLTRAARQHHPSQGEYQLWDFMQSYTII